MFVRGVGWIESDLRNWPHLLRRVADSNDKLCRVWIINPRGIGSDLEFENDTHIDVFDLIQLHRERKERLNPYAQLKILKPHHVTPKPVFSRKGSKKFFDKFLEYEANIDDFHSAIDEWHGDESLNGTSIYQHLGLTFGQYGLFIRWPEHIEKLRANGDPKFAHDLLNSLQNGHV